MRAYERLLNYVKVYTTSDPVSDTHPTTARQFDLARMLVKELQDLGLADAHVDEHCYVYATLPATPGHEAAKGLGFIAHMDTSPDAPGENVKPQIHENYDGGDVVLPGTGAVLSTRQFPFLAKLKGQTLITTDGTTLLGADDKAGVAEIMTMLEILQKEDRPHGKICVGFTPDEEVGQGADLFDVEHFGAAYAYTVDGDEAGEISYENFNAAAAFVTVHGFSVHPGSAKNAMKNAQNIAIEFHNALPYYDRPEYTENREGFYHLCSMEGDVTGAKLGYIVRDHSAESFAARKETMRHIAKLLNEKYGEGTVELELKDSYFSMLEKIKPHFHLVENARAAIRKAGLEPLETPIRGGTDGATLSYMGLPCPNLGTGGFNYHAAVDAYERNTVERIILTRPAVEAGERLGFLPGDLSQKVDPYLRPLYDALFDLLGFEKTRTLMERQTIEIAPLAYMRGRTLNNAFIILDEAQNTTPEQMKMFLTRIGFGSKAVITGDITQIDLPHGTHSGLIQAQHVLAGVRGIAFTYFTAADVVRHPLVARIVEAYEKDAESREKGRHGIE